MKKKVIYILIIAVALVVAGIFAYSPKQEKKVAVESNEQTWDQKIQKAFAESGMNEFDFTISQMIMKSTNEAEIDALKKLQVAYDNDNLDSVSFEDYKTPVYDGSLAMIDSKIICCQRSTLSSSL